MAMQMDHLARDCRYACRALVRAPVFLLTSTIIVALGIGADLALFQVVNAVLFEPLRVKSPSTLVRLNRHSPQMQSNALPYPAAELIRLESPALSAVLMRSRSEIRWQTDGIDRVPAAFVSSNWFAELGYDTALGRPFSENDARPEAEPAVVISDRLWRRRLGASPAAIGQVIRINDRTATIIGVAPAEFPGFRFEQTGVWALVDHLRYFTPGRAAAIDWNTELEVYGRLRADVSVATAREQLRGTAKTLAAQHPEQFHADGWIELSTAAEHFRVGRERQEAVTVAAMFGGLALLILIIACFNLTGLLLSRLAARSRELSMRAVMGARPWLTAQPIVLEVLIISIMGGVAGLFVATGTLRIVATIADLPEYVRLAPNLGTIVAAFVAVLLAACIIALVPGWRLARSAPILGLREGSHAASQGPSASRFRRQLVAVQIAGSCLLLVCSSQMVISVQSILSARQRLDFDRMVVFEPRLSEHGMTETAAEAYWDELKRVMRADAHVETLALASQSPSQANVSTSEHANLTGATIASLSIEPEWFSMAGITLIAGRYFDPSDDPIAPVIISRTLAQRMYGTNNPVGHPYPTIDPKHIIVGIVEDAKLRGEHGTSLEEYVPVRSREARVMILKAREHPATLMASVSASARAVDSRIRGRPRLMVDALQDELRAARVAGRIASMVAALGLGLSCIGIFGLISYNTRLRLKEIGIRLALGARSSSIVLLTLREMVWIGGGGLMCGLILGRIVAEGFRAQALYLQTPDWRAHLAAASVFTIAAGVAVVWPVLSALRGHAIAALRAE